MSSCFSQSRTDFGFKDVDAAEKERMVKDIFSKVAAKYDVMNDFMSMGAHRLWKDELINMFGYSSAAKIDPNYLPRHLDVAGGTGDVSFRSVNEMTKCFGKAASKAIHDEWTETLPQADRQIVVCDINPEMLAVGKDRAVSQVGKEKSKLVRTICH
jgi:ubiquinone/menaquinone biosynthesis C-methylase UbiE